MAFLLNCCIPFVSPPNIPPQSETISFLPKSKPPPAFLSRQKKKHRKKKHHRRSSCSRTFSRPFSSKCSRRPSHCSRSGSTGCPSPINGGHPIITSISPSSGRVGTTVTVRGNNFCTVNQVTVGFVNASFTVQSSNQVSVTIPSSLVPSSVNIILVSPSAGVSNAVPFTVVT